MSDAPDLAQRLEEERRQLLDMKRAALAAAEKQATKIDARVSDIDAALEGIYAKRTRDRQPTPATAPMSPQQKRTIKQMAIEILGLMPGGATSQELLKLIRDRYGPVVERESMSPQLSRLKGDGIIELRGKTWFLSAGCSDLPGNPETPAILKSLDLLNDSLAHLQAPDYSEDDPSDFVGGHDDVRH